MIPSFFSAWLTIELAPWWLLWDVVITAALVAAGGSRVGWGGRVRAGRPRRGRDGRDHAGDAPDGGQRPHRARRPGYRRRRPCVPGSHVLFPMLMNRRKGVRRVRNSSSPKSTASGCGSTCTSRRGGAGRAAAGDPADPRRRWAIGDKRDRASRCSTTWARRLGRRQRQLPSQPEGGVPDPSDGLKRAVRWYREHAEEYGADPGSSRHRRVGRRSPPALMALTANEPEYQPGFEDVDTRSRPPSRSTASTTSRTVRRVARRYVSSSSSRSS